MGLPSTITTREKIDQDITNLSSLLYQKTQNAFLEELLDLEKFNQETNGRFPLIDTGIDRIKKISPQNSKLLKARALNAADVGTLLEMIAHTRDLEELSLENALFYVEPGECVRTSSIGRDEWNNERNDWEHISDDGDWREEPISEKEYFWEEERPFTKIITALQQHSHSLKKLSFAYVTFNGRSEGARILHELREMSFPHLGELSLVGNIIDRGAEEDLAFLSNLRNHFPQLRGVYHGFPDPIFIPSESLPEAVRIFKEYSSQTN